MTWMHFPAALGGEDYGYLAHLPRCSGSCSPPSNIGFSVRIPVTYNAKFLGLNWHFCYSWAGRVLAGRLCLEGCQQKPKPAAVLVGASLRDISRYEQTAKRHSRWFSVIDFKMIKGQFETAIHMFRNRGPITRARQLMSSRRSNLFVRSISSSLLGACSLQSSR
jgi:hypothetical protein